MITTPIISTILALGGGGTIVVNIMGAINKKTPFEITVDAVILTFYLLLGYGFIVLVVRGLGRGLLFFGNWYPDFFYFPYPDSFLVIRDCEIVLKFANRKRQRMSSQAFFNELIQMSDVPVLPNLANGIAPPDEREVFPLDDMSRGSVRERTIGKIEDGRIIFVIGKNGQNELIVDHPGFYEIIFDVVGKYREREYQGHDKFEFQLTRSGEMRIINHD